VAGTIPVLAQRAASEEQEGGQPDHPLCSQNAHDKTVLVRCAQLRAALATPLKGGIGNWKALARDKARLGALRAGWVEYCAQLGSSRPPLMK
jgi:hypothetical protein